MLATKDERSRAKLAPTNKRQKVASKARSYRGEYRERSLFLQRKCAIYFIASGACSYKQNAKDRERSSLLQRRGVPYSEGSPLTISTVFRLTEITCPIKSTIYRGWSARFGSLTIQLRLSTLTRY